MTQKIVLTKSGFNAVTETDARNKIFDSSYETLKYFSSGEVTVARSGASASGTFTHNLGYIPFFIVYVDYSADDADFVQCPFYFADFTGYVFIAAWADSTKLYFEVEASVAPPSTLTYHFEYKIFRNDTGL